MPSQPDSSIESPFEHPAAREANRIFLTLNVRSEEDYRNLSRRERFVWDVCWLETEVTNGGVDQFFYNESGDHALETVAALQAIGARESHAMLKEACDLFPDGQPSAECEVRRQQLRAITGKEHLDDKISGQIEVDLYQHLLDYYRSSDPQAK